MTSLFNVTSVGQPSFSGVKLLRSQYLTFLNFTKTYDHVTLLGPLLGLGRDPKAEASLAAR